MKTILHDGEVWLALPTGGGAFPDGYSLGVLFVGQTTRREAFGRMRNVPLEDFNVATPDQLRLALISALSSGASEVQSSQSRLVTWLPGSPNEGTIAEL